MSVCVSDIGSLCGQLGQKPAVSPVWKRMISGSVVKVRRIIRVSLQEIDVCPQKVTYSVCVSVSVCARVCVYVF